jgi:hypothetical protein
VDRHPATKQPFWGGWLALLRLRYLDFRYRRKYWT